MAAGSVPSSQYPPSHLGKQIPATVVRVHISACGSAAQEGDKQEQALHVAILAARHPNGLRNHGNWVGMHSQLRNPPFMHTTGGAQQAEHGLPPCAPRPPVGPVVGPGHLKHPQTISNELRTSQEGEGRAGQPPWLWVGYGDACMPFSTISVCFGTQNLAFGRACRAD